MPTVKTARIWLSTLAYQQILTEAERMWPLETGGVLAGYIDQNEELVILHASGPGPEAMHRSKNFTPDHNYQIDYLARLYRQHGNRADYLGDWHTHPNTAPRMSFTDCRTLKRIANYHEMHLATPLMLIAGEGNGSQWELKAHIFQPTRELLWNKMTSTASITYFTPIHE